MHYNGATNHIFVLMGYREKGWKNKEEIEFVSDQNFSIVQIIYCVLLNIEPLFVPMMP